MGENVVLVFNKLSQIVSDPYKVLLQHCHIYCVHIAEMLPVSAGIDNRCVKLPWLHELFWCNFIQFGWGRWLRDIRYVQCPVLMCCRYIHWFSSKIVHIMDVGAHICEQDILRSVSN